MNINVTKPFLPPIAEYQAYIEGIWKRVWLTNNGPLLKQRSKVAWGLFVALFSLRDTD